MITITMNTFGSIEAANILHRYDIIKNSHRLIEEQSIGDPEYLQTIFSAILDVSKLQGDVESFVRYLTSVQRYLIQQISPAIHHMNPFQINQKTVHQKIENLFYLGWVKSELFNYQSNLQRLFSNYLSKLVTKVNNADDSNCIQQQINYASDLEGSKLNEYLGNYLGKSLREAVELDHSEALKKVKSWLFKDVIEDSESSFVNGSLSKQRSESNDSSKSYDPLTNGILSNNVTSKISSFFIRTPIVSSNNDNDPTRIMPIDWSAPVPQLNSALNLMETALTSSFDDHFKQKQFIVAKPTDCEPIDDRLQLNEKISNFDKSIIASTNNQLSSIFSRQPPIGTKIDTLDQIERLEYEFESGDTLNDEKLNNNTSNVVSWSQIVKLPSNKPATSETSSTEFTLPASDCVSKSVPESKKDLDKRIKSELLSFKVFIGGISSECTSSVLIDSFARFGKINLQWPGVEINYSGVGEPGKAGYVFVIFENEDQVKKMLDECEFEFNAIKEEYGFYWTMTINQHLDELVEVKPWRLNDNQHIIKKVADFSKCHCLFVGGLHGVITAQILADFLNTKFGGVASVRLDLDKHSYPTGAAKVSFYNLKSFGEAVELQLDPFIIKTNCSICKTSSGPLYCRSCLEYFCELCFKKSHKSASKNKHAIHCRKSNVP